ncbi:WYL domain-containing protein, partial [bacterium]|nr:WYL domain-containing protein [bacterium]
LYPLKILNLEGYWYLIVHEPQDPNKIKTFHLNSIKDIKILNEYYTHDEDIVNKFDNAITAYYKVQNNPIAVQLFIEKEVARFFIRKPLSQQQRIIKTYQDGSLDLEITITDYMEIIPTIQRYIPYVKVIEPQELKDKISENIRKYCE